MSITTKDSYKHLETYLSIFPHIYNVLEEEAYARYENAIEEQYMEYKNELGECHGAAWDIATFDKDPFGDYSDDELDTTITIRQRSPSFKSETDSIDDDEYLNDACEEMFGYPAKHEIMRTLFRGPYNSRYYDETPEDLKKHPKINAIYKILKKGFRIFIKMAEDYAVRKIDNMIERLGATYDQEFINIVIKNNRSRNPYGDDIIISSDDYRTRYYKDYRRFFTKFVNKHCSTEYHSGKDNIEFLEAVIDSGIDDPVFNNQYRQVTTDWSILYG